MPAPLSKDLRQRIYNLSKELKPVQVAEHFRVSERSVRRIIKQFNETQSFAARKTGPKSGHKFKDVHRQAMRLWVEQKPDIYLRKIQQKFLEEFDLKISRSRLCNVLKEMKLTRKKNKRRASKSKS